MFSVLLNPYDGDADTLKMIRTEEEEKKSPTQERGVDENEFVLQRCEDTAPEHEDHWFYWEK